MQALLAAVFGGGGGSGRYPMARVRSGVDGETYSVRALPDRQAAADRLARIRGRLLALMKELRQGHGGNPIARRIAHNFDAAPARFAESTPDAEHTSYTLNKGEKVFMCLRQRDARESLVDENVLVFVALHEMAHIGTAETGHTKGFWQNFAWLLKIAEDMGAYTHTEFAAHPVPYCGMYISDAPTWNGGSEAGATSMREEK
jgi:hypothetical protein